MRNATFKGENKAKQADSAWALRRPPPGQSRDWPTLVVEIAFSETPSKLVSDVCFWLEGTKRTAQVVVTLTINWQNPQITLERWEQQNSHAHRVQKIAIYKVNQRTTVQGGPLVIGFKELFLRPSDTPRETDIQLGEEQLTLLATMIWEEQEQERGVNFYD